MALTRNTPVTEEEWRAAYGLTPERETPLGLSRASPCRRVCQDMCRRGSLVRMIRLGCPANIRLRAAYPSMYRGRLWTMRQFAGSAPPRRPTSASSTCSTHGETGLSTAFDMPSLMGHDSDDPRSLGEVGREGVAIDSAGRHGDTVLRDRRSARSPSMTINAPAAIMLAMYMVVAEQQGVPFEQLAGTIQTDILKEYIAQNEWCFPIDPAMRLVRRHDRVVRAGSAALASRSRSPATTSARPASTAVQELAFTLNDGLTYVEQAVERGLDVDDFAPRLSFFFNAQIDFFEEIAKFRAARRIWARELRETFGAKNQRVLADADPHARPPASR